MSEDNVKVFPTETTERSWSEEYNLLAVNDVVNKNDNVLFIYKKNYNIILYASKKIF